MQINEEEAYEILRYSLPEHKYARIVTIGRGGLSIAQKLAYHFGVPILLVRERLDLGLLCSTDLFVDDISCTGKTLTHVCGVTDTATLVTRTSSEVLPDYTGLVIESKEYINFSWEVGENE